jgi:hypothetical protein
VACSSCQIPAAHSPTAGQSPSGSGTGSGNVMRRPFSTHSTT